VGGQVGCLLEISECLQFCCGYLSLCKQLRELVSIPKFNGKFEFGHHFWLQYVLAKLYTVYDDFDQNIRFLNFFYFCKFP